MGLRQLYFLLGDLIDRLVYLKYGIAFILAFIGVKLFFHALHENELPFINGGEHVEWAPEIGTFTSLAVIVASMAVAVIASLLKIRSDNKRTVAEGGTPASVSEALHSDSTAEGTQSNTSSVDDGKSRD
jgi:tellurite resistance protein TerC